MKEITTEVCMVARRKREDKQRVRRRRYMYRDWHDNNEL